jgi:DNA helicase-2/ATP-dependent DNA helicase PcrA
MGFKLNDGQQKVVDHNNGPLLVVAGAGTGKTRVIVEKINKLLESNTDPSSILAVTFTEKAAAEMLERVLASRSELLPELAIMTFNGFGDAMLREFGIHIGLPRNFRLLSDQAQVVFFRERIDEFQLDYFLPLTASPDGIIGDILQLFGRLKQNIITPETYQTFAAELPSADETETLHKRKHQELADAYATYTRLARTENVIDYDDQIFLTIQLLEQRPNVRSQLQQRYQTLFIDEFQDTNPMQSRLIDLLYAGKPQSLIVVGDDDQSIYGWRGATLQNILSFKERYSDTKQAALTVNYRSGQAILDAAYKLIQHNNPNRLETSLNINKHLTSKQPGNSPALKRFTDIDAELAWLADDVNDRLSKLGTDEPISIAVLARSNNTAQAVHHALATADIPHQVIGATKDLYERPAVRTLTEFIRTLADPVNTTSLHHTLISDLFGISNEVIAPLAAKARQEHGRLETLLPTNPEVQDAIKLIQSLREESASTSVGRLLWKAITVTGYKSRLLEKAMSEEQAAAAILHLKQFFNTLREFENIALQPTAVQYLESLPALRAAGEVSDDGTLAINNSEVTVITIHKAKGLEWDTAYIPCLQEQTFPLKKQGDGLQPPDELRAGGLHPADEHYAEERRLAYVATTRARQNLIVSFADLGKNGSPRKPSRFINELFGAGSAEDTPPTDTSNKQQSLMEMPIETVNKVVVPANIFDGENVRLSVSQAATLMTCPLNFYYKYVLQAPDEPTPRTSYGSQLHGLFEAINRGRRSESLPPLTDLLAELEAGWNKAGYTSRTQQEKALAQAKITLTNFYINAAKTPTPYLIEEPFEVSIEPENITLHGRMDVVFNHEGVEIRDYKTGSKAKTDADAKKQAGASDQLTMYALAWQLLNGVIPAKVSLEFVDTGAVGSLGKTERGLETMRAKLAKAAEQIRAGDFPPGYRHDYCVHPPVNNE